MRFVTATVLLVAAIGVHLWNARGGNAVGFSFFRALSPEATPAQIGAWSVLLLVGLSALLFVRDTVAWRRARAEAAAAGGEGSAG